MTRRTALKTATAWTALSYSRILGANDRVRVAGLGTGGRCRYLLTLLKDLPGNEIVSVCDVYAPRREEAQAKIAPAATIETDFRAVLDRKDVDAVVIGAPDHWHVPMTIAAIAAGKDVYCEKPVTHDPAEADSLIRAVEDSTRIFQAGTQQRSWDHFQRGRELVVGGAIGQVGLIQTYWYQNYGPIRRPAEIDTEKLDWKAWLGSAPFRSFDPIRYTTWRWFWDYGGGSLTDLYCHWVDVIHWVMGTTEIETAGAIGRKSVHTEWDCPDTVSAAFIYKPGFQTTFDAMMTAALDGGGLLFRGTKGLLRLNRDGYWLYPEGAVPGEATRYPEPIEQRRSTGDGTRSHLKNWLDCVQSRAVPNAPVRAAVAAAAAAHRGNQVLRHTMNL
jgi:predicted dehydrogenase